MEVPHIAGNFETLSKSVEASDDKKVLEIIKEELDKGTAAMKILEEGRGNYIISIPSIP